MHEQQIDKFNGQHIFREKERDKLIELIKVSQPMSRQNGSVHYSQYSQICMWKTHLKSKLKLLNELLFQIKDMITNGVSTWKYTNVKIFITFIICTL